MVVQLNAESVGDARGGAQEVNSALDSAFNDDDSSETVKGVSDDGLPMLAQLYEGY